MDEDAVAIPKNTEAKTNSPLTVASLLNVVNRLNFHSFLWVFFFSLITNTIHSDPSPYCFCILVCVKMLLLDIGSIERKIDDNPVYNKKLNLSCSFYTVSWGFCMYFFILPSATNSITFLKFLEESKIYSKKKSLVKCGCKKVLTNKFY